MNIFKAGAVHDVQEAVIECLPSCLGPANPPRYPPEVYRNLVLEFYTANYFHQKGYAGSPATAR